MPQKSSHSVATPTQTDPRRRHEVAPFDARRRQEPAAAPFDTDGEAGNASGRTAGAPPAREAGQPIDPVTQTDRADTGEVRAGPGDAGRQDRPERLPRGRPRSRSAAAVSVALVLFLSGLAVMAVWWLGAI